MVIAYVPLLVAIIGLLLWLLASKPVLAEIGKWMFVIGLFWTIYATVGHTAKIL